MIAYGRYILLLGVIGVVGVVTGEGSRLSDDCVVLTVNNSCGRIVKMVSRDDAPTASEEKREGGIDGM